MSMDFKSFLVARRRGNLLGALQEAHKEAPGQTVAPDVLHKYLLAIGMRPTLHMVEMDVDWLAGHNLVAVSRVDGHMFVRITQHGIEAAARRVQVAGVDVSELEG